MRRPMYFFGLHGAGDAIRTRDIFLGKEVLYQLSYTRILTNKSYRSKFWLGIRTLTYDFQIIVLPLH